MSTEASLKENALHDITHWGISASIGVIFIIHSLKKFDPSWQEWLMSIGMPPIGSTVVDAAGVALLTDWVNGLTGCQ